MTDYAKVTVSVLYSPNSDYSSPILTESLTATYTPSEYLKLRVSAPTAGVTVDLVTFTTPTVVVIYNKDATNYVSVAYNSTADAHTVRVAAGEATVLSDVLSANDLVLTANTAAVVCDVIVFGD